MKISHIALFTNNLESMKDFYVRYFQGTSNEIYNNPASGFRSYFVRFDSGASLELMSKEKNLTERNNEESCIGYAHIAFKVPSHEAVDGLTRILKTDGYKIIKSPRITGDGYYESCIIDPDGNEVEITC